MNADYPGAIVVEAANYGYFSGNRPLAWCLHTPEEPADDDPQTPYYFHNTNRDASTTYFVSYWGFVFQCVPESEGAYANAVEGKPYPDWADSTRNLNLQTLSVEIEGFAASIHQTMPRGSPQWKALVELMAHRCKALNIPPERTFGHYEVSIYRSDPGQLNTQQVIADVITKMEKDMVTDAQFEALQAQVNEIQRTAYTQAGVDVYAAGLRQEIIDAVAPLQAQIDALETAQRAVGLKRGDSVQLT